MDLPFGFEEEYAAERSKMKKSLVPKFSEWREPKGCDTCLIRHVRCKTSLLKKVRRYIKYCLACPQHAQSEANELYPICDDPQEINIKKTEEGLDRDEKRTLRSVQLDTLMKMRRQILEAHKRVRSAMWKLHACKANQQKPFIMWHQSTH